MTKRDKRLERLLAKPKDFTWDEMLAVMKQYNCQWFPNGGGSSHGVFQHESGLVFNSYRPHPSGIVLRYQLSAAIEFLKRVNEVEEEG